jgi:hypothetical protein
MSQINWIKASLKGRLGEVVGSSWRGKPYTKVYTPPTDPHTQGQTDVRGIFAHVGHMAHLVYHEVLEPYTYPIPHEETKYNRMMQINKGLYAEKVYDPSKLQIMQGPLMLSEIDSFGYADYDGQTDVQWYPGGEGDRAQDICAVMVYAEELDKTYIVISTRGKLEEILTLPTGLTAAQIHCYLIQARPPSAPGDPGEVSNTSYMVAEASSRKSDTEASKK